MTYEPPTTKNPYGSYKPDDSQILMEQRLEAVFQGAIKLRDQVDELERDVRFLFIMVVVLLVANVLLAVTR